MTTRTADSALARPLRCAAWLAMLLGGCGAGRVAAGSGAEDAAAAGVVEAPVAGKSYLLELLPANVERCALLSLGQLDAGQVEGLQALGLTQAFLWQVGVPLDGVAAVSRAAGGARAVAYAFETTASPAEVERALRRLGRFQVRVGGGPQVCLPDDCPLVLTFPKEGVVRLDLGGFFGPDVLSESGQDCRGLAAAGGELVAIMSERVMPTMGPAVGPLQVRLRVTAPTGELSLAVHDVFIDEEAAQEARSLLPFHSLLKSPVAGLMGTRVRADAGRQVISSQHLGRDDLAWLRRDAKLRALSRRYGQLLLALPREASLPKEERQVLARLSEYRALLEVSAERTPGHPLAVRAQALCDEAAARFPDSPAVTAAVVETRALASAGTRAPPES